MLYFPQISTGCLAQFPISKRQGERTVVNDTIDGRQLRASDLDASTVRWELKYSNLADAEKECIESLFVSAQGRLRPFVFVDPTANVLSGTDDLNAAQWNHGPLISATGNVGDPLGGTNAWTVRNSGAAPSSIAQALGCPPTLRYCFSVYVKSGAADAVDCVLRIRNSSGQVDNRGVAGPSWTRVCCSGSLPDSPEPVTFEFEIPAAAAVDVYGFQVDAQPSPSPYKPSVTGGLYPNARFEDDVLQVRTDGANNHAITVRLISRASS